METSASVEPKQESRKRVPCPIDPSHTVFEDKLSKHIRVCNKTKKEEEKANCPYFIPNFNSGNVELPNQKVFANEDEVIPFRECNNIVEASV